MITQNSTTKIVGTLLIASLQTGALNLPAQVQRQESTNQLKKVVYTFDPSTCPQLLLPLEDHTTCQYFGTLYFYYYYRYYAVVTIPEIAPANMPSVEIWRTAPYAPPSTWVPMPTVRLGPDLLDIGPTFTLLTNGGCGILWKIENQPPGFPTRGWQTNNYCPALQVTNVFAISNKVVVLYEPPNGPGPFTLSASTSPSGVSLTIPTTTSRTYAVEYAPVLPPTGSWSILVSNIPGTGGVASVTDSNTAKQRFYRASEK